MWSMHVPPVPSHATWCDPSYSHRSHSWRVTMPLSIVHGVLSSQHQSPSTGLRCVPLMSHRQTVSPDPLYGKCLSTDIHISRRSCSQPIDSTHFLMQRHGRPPFAATPVFACAVRSKSAARSAQPFSNFLVKAMTDSRSLQAAPVHLMNEATALSHPATSCVHDNNN